MPSTQDWRVARAADRKPLVIAHRGASGLAPENTLAAFRLAIALGADGVEMDARLSADGHPVVIHDLLVDRTTDGRGPVSSFTVEELRKLDAGRWFERRLSVRPRLRAMSERAKTIAGNGSSACVEHVPTLRSVLALLAPADPARVYIELKGEPESKQILLQEIIALVRKFRMEHSATLLSFDHSIVKRAKEIAPDIRTAATFSIAGRQLATARSIIRAAEGVAADEVAIHFGLANRRTVGAIQERGLSVSVWTANNKIVMRPLIACGVDSIMTNFPDRLIEAVTTRASRRTPLRESAREGREQNL